MGFKWYPTKFQGLRYREHLTRKNGAVKKDVCYQIRFTLDSKRFEETLGWATEGWTLEKAALKLGELKEAQRTGEGERTLSEKRQKAEEARQQEEQERERLALEKYTFGELMDEYLDWAKSNKRHWKDDLSRYNKHLKKPLAHIPLKDISPFLLEKVKKKIMDKGLSAAMTKHCLVIVRQAFNKAVYWGKWTGENPVKGVKLPKLNNRKERVLTIEEEKLLLNAIKPKSLPTWAMAMTSLNAGLRFEEITKLRWQTVDLESGQMHVDGKDGRPRTVPINKTLKAVFEKIRPDNPHPTALLFPDKKGGVRRFLSATYAKAVKALAFNDDVEDNRYRVNFHTLRHTWATRLGNAGVSLNVLRDMGGWADFQMVSRYTKSDRDLAAKAVQELDKLHLDNAQKGKVLQLKTSN